MPRFYFILLAVCSLFNAGCTRVANPSNYTVSPPKFEDIVGSYVPNQRTHELLKATGKYPNSDSSIALNKDGSVTMTNVPDWWLTSYSDAKGQFDSGVGTWTLDKNKNWWLVVVTFSTQQSRFSSPVPRKGNVTAMLSLVGQKSPYTLQMSISDSNADVAMQYQKVIQ